nr:sulfotransferase 3 [Vargula tsujii]
MTTFPYKFEEYQGGVADAIKLNPGGWVMLSTYQEDAEKLYNFGARPDDIWLVGHPKTGTTWSSELLWTVLHDADVEGARTIPQMDRICYPEYDFIIVKRDLADMVQECKKLGKEVPEKLLKESTKSHYQMAVEHPSPRLLRTGMCLELLSPKLLDTCKVVYVTRNPLDTCVSFYHFINSMEATKEHVDFQDFFQLFLADLVPFGPFWKHVKYAWEKRHHPNMLFLFYEDMKADLPGVIKKVADFVGKSLTEEQIERVAQYLSFDEMKKNKMVNLDSEREMGVWKKDSDFVRKGIVGDYKNHMTPEMIEQLRKWWKEHMEDCDIKFPGFDEL